VDTRRHLARLTVAALLALPVAPALAQQTPFAPLPAPTTTQQAPTTTTGQTTTSTGRGLQTWQALLIVAGGVAVIVGIGLYIARDARRRAPIAVGDTEAAHRDPSAHKSAREAKRKTRARQKAARAQRRRNR
jgi:hypothetical protein